MNTFLTFTLLLCPCKSITKSESFWSVVCFCLLACKATSGAGRSVCSLSVPAFITSVPPSHFGTIKTGIRSLGKGRFPLHGFQGNKLAQTGQRRAGLTRIAASVNDQDVDNMTVKEMRNELNSRGVYHQVNVLTSTGDPFFMLRNL